MPTLYQNEKAQTERTNKQGANDIVDAELFAFVHQFAPSLTALYSRGNDTKNKANMFCFVGNGGIESARVFVRQENVTNLLDARLAVIHAATMHALYNAAINAYAAKNNGAQLDSKSAQAIVKQNIVNAYKKMIARAIDAGLFSQETELQAIAREYANGKYRDNAPFGASQYAEMLPQVQTRGVTVTTFNRAAHVAALDVDVDVDALIDAAFA